MPTPARCSASRSSTPFSSMCRCVRRSAWPSRNNRLVALAAQEGAQVAVGLGCPGQTGHWALEDRRDGAGPETRVLPSGPVAMMTQFSGSSQATWRHLASGSRQGPCRRSTLRMVSAEISSTLVCFVERSDPQSTGP